MKAADFAYEKPDNLNAALELLAREDCDMQVLAGGQSLMPMMNFRLAQPELLVDLNGVSELSFIEEQPETITIGAMTRYANLAASDVIKEHVPLFQMALPHIAHSAVRNRGTIGGSTALADPAAEMPALLLALEATITVVSVGGAREIPANDFFLGLYETALQDGEIIKSIAIKKAKPQNRFGFYELARRHGDYAMAGVAIASTSIDPVCDLRIALFSVSDKAHRLPHAELAFEGENLDDTEARDAAFQELDDFDFRGDLNADGDTKRHLARVVLTRALETMMP